MREIKINLESEEEIKENIVPVAGLIVEFTDANRDRDKRLIVKKGHGFMAIDLKYMEYADSTPNMVCLREESNPKIIGKLTLSVSNS